MNHTEWGTVAGWVCILVLGALFGGTPDIADAIMFWLPK